MTRHDIYGRAHKALRAIMSETLVALGRANLAEDCEAREALARLEEMLAFCETHARLENEFIHRALEERRPDAACGLAREHAAQDAEIAQLREAARRLEPTLHRQVALFVARNFLHMEDEETHGNALLHEAFSDEEISAIERRLVGSRPAAEAMASLRWMLPAMSHPERVALLQGMRHAPPAVFEGALAVARSHLAPRDVQRLEEVLG